MATNYVQEGQVIDYTANENLLSGDVVNFNNVLGVALGDAGVGEGAAIKLDGVFRLAKKSTDSIQQGVNCFWDPINKYITTTEKDNIFAGFAFADAGSGAGEVAVKLNNVSLISSLGTAEFNLLGFSTKRSASDRRIWISPKENGCKLDGVTDDTDNFNSFITKIHVIQVNSPHPTNPDQTSGQSAAFIFENINFYGDDYELDNGLLNLYSLSQSTLRDCSFTRCKGAGVNSTKMEDIDFIRCNFGYLNSAFTFEGDSIGLASNIIRILQGRFEWISEGFLKTIGADGKINGLEVLFSKFEVNKNDELDYGATRGDYGIFDFINGSGVDRVAINHCWIQQADKAKTILRLNECKNINFSSNKIAIAEDAEVKLFEISDGTSDTVDAENIRIYDNDIASSAPEVDNFKVTFENNSQNPVVYEIPNYERYSGIVDGVNNFYDTSKLGWLGRVLPDPEPVTDPCLSVAGGVMGFEGGTQALIGLLSSDINLNKLSGVVGTNGQKFLKLGVRAKKAGNVATAAIRILNEDLYITQINLDNTTWEIKEVYINLRDLDLSKDINIRTSVTNEADHICYVDGVYVDFTDYTKSAALPISGTFAVGDIVYNTTPAAAGTLGWVCVTAGQAEDAEWQAATVYTADDLVYNGANVYICTTGGTSAGSGGPTGTGAGITDGTVEWNYVNTLAVFKTFGTIEA